MPRTDDREFRATLERYADAHPELATYTGDTLVIKSPPLRTGSPALVALYVVSSVIFIVVGLAALAAVGKFSRELSGGHGTAFLVQGALLVVTIGSIPLILILALVGRQRTTVTIDLVTGDTARHRLFKGSPLANMASVVSYRMQTTSALKAEFGRTVWRSCLFNAVVDGRVRSETIAYFASDDDMEAFAPVARALIQHFSEYADLTASA